METYQRRQIAAANRQAVADARRRHLGSVRAIARTYIEESHQRRQEISHALVELRRGVSVFRSQLRKNRRR